MAETTLQQILSSLHRSDTLLNEKFSNILSSLVSGIFDGNATSGLFYPLTASLFDGEKKLRLDYIPVNEIISGKLDKLDATTPSGLITTTSTDGKIVNSNILLGNEEEWNDLILALSTNVDNICGEDKNNYFN